MLARRVGSLTAARCLESQSSGWLLEGVSYFSLIGAPARCVAPRQAVWGQAGYYSRCPPPDLSSRKMSSKGSKQKNKKGDIPEDIMYLKMPSLGFSMKSGRVAEWLVEEGEHVPENALVCIVQTENLVPEEEKTGMFRGTSTLEVELTDGGWVARHLIDTSKEAPVGEPILAVCSSKEEAEQAAKVDVDTLREEARKVGIGSGKEALWQAYLHRSMGKEDKKRGKFVDE